MLGQSSARVIDFIRTRIAAARQTPSQIFQRLPGDRFLSGPAPARQEAEVEWQFALLSVAAYGRSNPKHEAASTRKNLSTSKEYLQTHRQAALSASTVDATLEACGWKRWSDFPDQALEVEMRNSHLRAEVWENRDEKKIVVAFGGTVFSSGKDWLSNLRWFIPWHKDEYTTIVERFGPDFVEDFTRRLRSPTGEYLRDVAIFATGHSLGGGLAQQFGYSLPIDRAIQKIKHVYAFDPSPVTGFYSVRREVRNYNKENLEITRSYERGEILAILRSFTSVFVKPSAKNPEIRGVRFSLFYTLNPLAGHSMLELAERMRAAASNGPSNERVS